MKIAESLKLIDGGWVKKRSGFRVKFDQRSDTQWVTEFCPAKEANPLDSDVTAWRLAWKLARSCAPGAAGEAELANVMVVDQEDNPVTYYATNSLKIFNPKEVGSDEKLEKSP